MRHKNTHITTSKITIGIYNIKIVWKRAKDTRTRQPMKEDEPDEYTHTHTHTHNGKPMIIDW